VAGDAEDPLKSHRREVTVVFLDLRGFTAFAETAEPEEVMSVLREYHAEMGKLILEHEGTLERFTGDGMMVFFNDPVPVPNPAERATRMALAMRERVRDLRVKWRKRGVDLDLGIGIAQGYATIGAIGFEGRLDYGAIGTVTNLAARLCGEARPGQLLVPQRMLGMVEELVEAEVVVLPLVLVFLVVVFGSVVAATLPLAVGLLGVAAGMAATGLLARVMPVSAYAANVVSMIGLGVAIDYSLFVVSRYREELLTHAPPQALARTLATAGRTVIFSGMAVGIGLLGMILLRMGSVSTIGIASTVVVGFAVLYSLTLLPALLAILGPRVNALSLLRRPARVGERSIWHRLATAAMARPWHVLVPVVLILIVLGLPFRHIHLGTPDITTLPDDAESRRGEELLGREFPQLSPTSIVVVVSYPDATGLTPARVDELYTLSRWLARQPGVTRVESEHHARSVQDDGDGAARDAAAADARGVRADDRAPAEPPRRADGASRRRPGRARPREDDSAHTPPRGRPDAGHRPHRI